MTAHLDQYSWAVADVGLALESLARESGINPRRVELPAVPQSLCLPGSGTSPELSRWVEDAANWLGFEAEPVETAFSDVEEMVSHAGPALLTIDARSGDPRFLCVLGRHRRKLELLAPTHRKHLVPIDAVCDALIGPLAQGPAGSLEELLASAEIGEAKRPTVARSILTQLMASVRVKGCWMLRLQPGAPFVKQLTIERLPRHLFAFLFTHVLHLVATLGAWYMVGRGALTGRLDPQWLIAWALLLLTTVPIKLAMEWSKGVFAVGMGRILKQRLLAGALKLRPREIRHQGAGQLLGRVVESSAVGSLTLGAALSSVIAIIELIVAASILAAGAGGSLHVTLLLVWIVLTIAIGLRYQRRFGRWTEWRVTMTNDLVERMVGHRTRLAQEGKEEWHRGEDESLQRYIDLSEKLDGTLVQFTLWLSRGWLLFGIAGLVPAFISGASMTPLAIGLGGVLLASQALGTLTGTLSSIAGAVIAWDQAKLLFKSAARKHNAVSPSLAITSTAAQTPGASTGPTVVEADDVTFRYNLRGEPVLRGCTVRLGKGDRALLEGPSGGGKSTLVSLLTGLRQPESGLVLLKGLDWQTLGADGWRKLVATAPQFQENHILTGTLAFNLLMGRQWPASNDELAEAEQICRELGLGPLLDEMPSGMMQIVGETGWRLSHGEQSRVFIARALLQGADLVILDESFAALDPENLQRAMHCVLDRAPTLLVVVHP